MLCLAKIIFTLSPFVLFELISVSPNTIEWKIIMNKYKRFSKLKTILIFLFWILVWQLIYVVVDKEIFMVSPLNVLKKFMENLKYPEFYNSILFSFIRIFSGFLLGMVTGILLAVITSANKLLYMLFSPVITIIKTVPAASIILLIFIWLKSYLIPTFISFLLVMPLFYINTYKGIIQTDKKLTEMAEIFGFSKLKKIKYIYIPSIFPYFLTAFSSGFGFAWKSGITAEILCSPSYSIGTNLKDAKTYLETTDIFLWTAVIIIISLVFEKLMLRIMEKAFPYIRRNNLETEKYK